MQTSCLACHIPLRTLSHVIHAELMRSPLFTCHVKQHRCMLNSLFKWPNEVESHQAPISPCLCLHSGATVSTQHGALIATYPRQSRVHPPPCSCFWPHQDHPFQAPPQPGRQPPSCNPNLPQDPPHLYPPPGSHCQCSFRQSQLGSVRGGFSKRAAQVGHAQRDRG